MLSMTGFGSSRRTLDEIEIAVDIKTVNNRYLDINARLPKEFAALEPLLRKEIQSRLRRGRVDLFLNLIQKTSNQYEVNEALVRNYAQLGEKLRNHGVSGHLDVATLLGLPGVVVQRQFDFSGETVMNAILSVISEALEQVYEVRRAEGAILKVELQSRITRLKELLETVKANTSQIKEYHQNRLNQRIQEMQAGPMDESRLAQEILFYVERSDISEEIGRLESHIQRFGHYLKESEATDTGKTLDFLCQEMNREMNTILSKASLKGVSEAALDGKTEVEKIREQVQNVE
jgi:uncharacterized protein (TIGR00255 family)